MSRRTQPRPQVPPRGIDRVKARQLLSHLVHLAFGLRNIFLILILIIVLGGVGFTVLDGKTIAEGQYLALITAMTVGYGDLAPVSWPARIVSGIVGINGLILTGVVVACVVKALELTFRDSLEEIEDDAKQPRPPSDE